MKRSSGKKRSSNKKTMKRSSGKKRSSSIRRKCCRVKRKKSRKNKKRVMKGGNIYTIYIYYNDNYINENFNININKEDSEIVRQAYKKAANAEKDTNRNLILSETVKENLNEIVIKYFTKFTENIIDSSNITKFEFGRKGIYVYAYAHAYKINNGDPSYTLYNNVFE